MSKSKTERIGSHAGKGLRWAKTRTRRLFRRWRRRDPEDAPRKHRHRGYLL